MAQALEPTELEYLPAAQLAQLEAPAPEYRPTAQLWPQAAARPVALLYQPAAQCAHEAAPTRS
jgi:hypothetical protein